MYFCRPVLWAFPFNVVFTNKMLKHLTSLKYHDIHRLYSYYNMYYIQNKLKRMSSCNAAILVHLASCHSIKQHGTNWGLLQCPTLSWAPTLVIVHDNITLTDTNLSIGIFNMILECWSLMLSLYLDTVMDAQLWCDVICTKHEGVVSLLFLTIMITELVTGFFYIQLVPVQLAASTTE